MWKQINKFFYLGIKLKIGETLVIKLYMFKVDLMKSAWGLGECPWMMTRIAL